MREPDWSLLKDGKVDVFEAFDFATDRHPRLRPIRAGHTDDDDPDDGQASALVPST